MLRSDVVAVVVVVVVGDVEAIVKVDYFVFKLKYNVTSTNKK